MSIYRQHGWNNLNEVHQFRVPPKVAAREVSPPSEPSVTGSHDWSRLRKAKPAERLLPLSKKWLELLPPDVFPGALATRYPRIVNYIAVQWGDRRWCATYFNELLTDQRGGRQGFPDAVKRDLEKLLDYWCTGAEAESTPRARPRYAPTA